MSKLGKIVHFVLGDDTAHPGHCRPATVVRDWSAQDKDGSVNLVVTIDGTNDAAAPHLQLWKTSVTHSVNPGLRNSWHRASECPLEGGS